MWPVLVNNMIGKTLKLFSPKSTMKHTTVPVVVDQEGKKMGVLCQLKKEAKIPNKELFRKQ